MIPSACATGRRLAEIYNGWTTVPTAYGAGTDAPSLGVLFSESLEFEVWIVDGGSRLAAYCAGEVIDLRVGKTTISGFGSVPELVGEVARVADEYFRGSWANAAGDSYGIATKAEAARQALDNYLRYM